MTCQAPEHELLAFWTAGTLSSEEAARVKRHLAGCPSCQASATETEGMLQGIRALHLTSEEAVAAAWGEGSFEHLHICARCREEVETLRAMNRDLQKPAAGAGWRQSLAWAAGLAFVALSTATLLKAPHPAPPVTTAPGLSVEAPAPPARIRVRKASLDALARETVRLRGAAAPRRLLLEDLAKALEPYRRDDFEEAATRLGALRPRYPEAGEIPYYLGVCLLLLDRPDEALAPLEDAVSRLTEADEARYYLAIAQVNASRPPLSTTPR